MALSQYLKKADVKQSKAIATTILVLNMCRANMRVFSICVCQQCMAL